MRLCASKASSHRIFYTPATSRDMGPTSTRRAGSRHSRARARFEIFDNSVTVLETVDPDNVTRVKRELPGWGCASLEVSATPLTAPPAIEGSR